MMTGHDNDNDTDRDGTGARPAASGDAPAQGGPKGPIRDTLRAPLPKRFYKSVTLCAHEGASGPGQEVLLDGRPLRTPLKRILVVPDAALAQVIAAEWDSQREIIDPATMPATRLANSAVDTVADNRAAVAEEVVAYAGSDLICYRAEAPAGLVAHQIALWDPILSAVEDALGARFVRVAGIRHAAQPPQTLARVAMELETLPHLTLAGLQLVTTITGSAILALARHRGLASADAVWAAAHADEDWQIAQWGHDAEAEARRALQERDFRAAVSVLGPSSAA